MFQAHVLIIRRSKLYYTASGIITPIGGHPVQRLREEKQKFYASSWLITKINTYTEMHCQQNIKGKQNFYTISGHINIMVEGSNIVSAQYLDTVQLLPTALKKVAL